MFGLRQWINSVKSKTGLFIAEKPEQPVIYAPGTKISYDDLLVSRLKQDHVQLLKIFGQIMKAADDSNFSRIRFHLDAFLKLFNAHALTEYTKLYIFLDHAFKQDEENSELIREFKREMNDIGKAVRAFNTKWMNGEISEYNIGDFTKQAQAIGDVLVRRVKTEEERLYEIYDLAPAMFRSTTLNH